MTKANRILIVLVALSLLVLAAGCVVIPEKDESFEPPPPVRTVTAQAGSGSIYQQGTEVRLFEDLKAGRVGDILTVRLIERTSTSKNSATATTKATEVNLGNPTVFGRPITRDGVPLFESSLNGDSEFEALMADLKQKVEQMRTKY